MPTPIYRQCRPPSGTEGVLRKVRKMKIPTGSKDFFFRFHWEVLPVKVWQTKKQFILHSTMVDQLHSLCRRRRNACACFPALQEGNPILGSIQKHPRRRSKPTLDPAEIFGLQTAHRPEAVASLVILALHSLWTFRTEYMEGQPDPTPPIDRFREKLSWTLSVLPEEDTAGYWRQVSDKLKDGAITTRRQVYGCRASFCLHGAIG